MYSYMTYAFVRRQLWDAEFVCQMQNLHGDIRIFVKHNDLYNVKTVQHFSTFHTVHMEKVETVYEQ